MAARTTDSPAIYDGKPDFTGTMGRDADGYIVHRADHMDYRLTECCHASAKGSMGAIVCRNCYTEIDPAIGGEPAAPYIGEGGGVVATKVLGWDALPTPAKTKTVYVRCERCSDDQGTTAHPADYVCTNA